MKTGEVIFCGACWVVTTAAVIAGGMAIHNANKACQTIGSSMKDVLAMSKVDVTDAIVKESMKRAADNACKEAANKAVINVQGTVDSAVSTAVSKEIGNQVAGLEDKVFNEMTTKLNSIDLSQAQAKVIQKASDRAFTKFDKKLDGILDQFGTKLSNIATNFREESDRAYIRHQIGSMFL